MYKFAIKFDSDKDKLDLTNAVPLDELGDLLMSIYAVLGASKSDKVFVSEIKDNCYQIGFNTQVQSFEQRFIQASQNISEKRDIELTAKEIRFKKSLNKILRENMYADILDTSDNKVVNIPYGFAKKSVEVYYSQKNIEGFITLIGDKELNPDILHIYLSNDASYKIFITAEQNEVLGNLYRKRKIRAKVKLRKSLSSDKILSGTLLDFKAKGESIFPNNLYNLDLSELNFKA